MEGAKGSASVVEKGGVEVAFEPITLTIFSNDNDVTFQKEHSTSNFACSVNDCDEHACIVMMLMPPAEHTRTQSTNQLLVAESYDTSAGVSRSCQVHTAVRPRTHVRLM